ncbi:hypothetical protein Tco_0070589 [Tanacetum coccineum]
MEECHKLLTDQVDDAILKYNVSKPLPLGGEPGHVTIQPDFFFNKDLEYLRYGRKCLSFLDAEECKYDIELCMKYPLIGGFKDNDSTLTDSHLKETAEQDRYGVQMILRFNEIHKFSDGTLQQIDEALDYRVKEFQINRTNPGMNTRFWTKKDVRQAARLHVRYPEKPNERRIFQNLEMLCGWTDPTRRLPVGPHGSGGSSKDGDGDTSFQWSQFTTQCSHLMFPPNQRHHDSENTYKHSFRYSDACYHDPEKCEHAGAYQIVREDGTDVVYINFGAMLKVISRDDLTELYRIVMNRYGMNGPEDELERVFWKYLKNMFEEPLSTDPIWSELGQQRIISWRYYESCRVHCLNLESMDVYMLIERTYPLSGEMCKAMLDKKLQGGKPDENCYKMLKMMEKQAGIRK